MSKESIDIHKLIDEAMEKKDRSVHIFIGAFGTNVQIEPFEVKEEPRWLEKRNDSGFSSRRYICSECGALTDFTSPYCPLCGEKLKQSD